MATSKQVFQNRIGVYVYKLGVYIQFEGYPKTIDSWNLDIEYLPDFLGDTVQQALTGYERGGTMGWRAVANLQLNSTTKTEAEIILKLFNVMQSQYHRLFFPESGTTTFSAKSDVSKTVTITNGSTTANAYTGLDLYNITKDDRYRITNYTAGRVATVDGDINLWAIDSDTIQVTVPPSYPTIIGLSPDTSDNNIEYFNIESGSTFGIQRQLTIGTQSINIQLRGVERKQNIPDNVRIG
jgi:hypothetical protein